jgi:hypothetical protein
LTAQRWWASLRIWWEAAWAHLLSRAGKNTFLLKHLRAVLARVTGAVTDLPPQPADAADLLAQLRLVVAERYPLAFRCPAT